MPSPPNLKTDYEADGQFMMAGSAVNKIHDLLNQQAGLHLQQVGSASFPHTLIPARPMYAAIATVVDAGESGALVNGEYRAPRASENKYLCRVRYWDFDAGVWKEHDEDVHLDAGAYFERPSTLVSHTPSAGPGFGQIPTYAVGDVLPCWFDPMRSWLVPVHAPFDQFPHAQYATAATQSVPLNDKVDTATYDAYIERQFPGEEEWVAIGGVSIRLPSDFEPTGGYDSRMGFTTTHAPHGTQFRVRHTRGICAGEVDVIFARIKFMGEARHGAAAVAQVMAINAYEGGPILAGWQLETDAPGRFKDSPSFDPIGQGFIARYADSNDDWLVRIDLEIFALISPAQVSSSTSPSSLSSSQSSSSASSASSATSSSTPTSSSESTSSASQTSSTTSSQSSRSSSSATMSQSSSSGYACIQFVSCVTFDETTCELTVTYQEVCFPGLTGLIYNLDIEPPC